MLSSDKVITAREQEMTRNSDEIQHKATEVLGTGKPDRCAPLLAPGPTEPIQQDTSHSLIQHCHIEWHQPRSRNPPRLASPSFRQKTFGSMPQFHEFCVAHHMNLQAPCHAYGKAWGQRQTSAKSTARWDRRIS